MLQKIEVFLTSEPGEPLAGTCRLTGVNLDDQVESVESDFEDQDGLSEWMTETLDDLNETWALKRTLE